MGMSNGIVEFFVRQLMDDYRRVEVPFYAATLPIGLQTQLSAIYLEGNASQFFYEYSYCRV